MEPDEYGRASQQLICLPSVAVSIILSELTWREKLHSIAAIPTWQSHLYTVDAWPCLHYVESNNSGLSDRRSLGACITNYGRYIVNVKLDFYFNLGKEAAKLFDTIAANCCTLRSLHVRNIAWPPLGAWTPVATQAYSHVLQKCTHISSITFDRPALAWERELPKENIITVTSSLGHAYKVKELCLNSDSLLFGFHNLLHQFTGLRKLRVRRDELEESVLLQLASHHLCELTTFQEEERPDDDAIMYTDHTWQQIVTYKPKFTYNLLLRNVILLRSCFLAFAPVRAVVLIDLASSLTKGIVDTICEHFKNTLETFVYTEQHHIRCIDVEDKRLPSALVNLATNCTFLTSLIYGFDISATTILKLAQVRKLTCFAVSDENLVFDMDWPIESDWSAGYIEWLQCAGSSLHNLQTQVSAMWGYKWTASSPSCMRQFATHSWHM